MKTIRPGEGVPNQAKAVEPACLVTCDGGTTAYCYTLDEARQWARENGGDLDNVEWEDTASPLVHAIGDLLEYGFKRFGDPDGPEGFWTAYAKDDALTATDDAREED